MVERELLYGLDVYVMVVGLRWVIGIGTWMRMGLEKDRGPDEMIGEIIRDSWALRNGEPWMLSSGIYGVRGGRGIEPELGFGSLRTRLEIWE